MPAFRATREDGLTAPTSWVRRLAAVWANIEAVALERGEGARGDRSIETVHTVERDELAELDDDQVEGESAADHGRRVRPLRRRAALELAHELWAQAEVDRRELGGRADYRLCIDVVGNDEPALTQWHMPKLSDGEEAAATQSELKRSDPIVAWLMRRDEKMFQLLIKANTAATENVVQMTQAFGPILESLAKLTAGHSELHDLRQAILDSIDDQGQVDWDAAFEKLATIAIGIGVSTGKIPASALGGLGFGPRANDPSNDPADVKVSQSKAHVASFIESLTDEQLTALDDQLGEDLAKDFAGLVELVTSDECDDETMREQVRKFAIEVQKAGKMDALGALLTDAQKRHLHQAAA